jgi:hypothetical protein
MGNHRGGLYLTIPAKTIAHSETVLDLLQALSEESIPPFDRFLAIIPVILNLKIHFIVFILC